MNDWDSRTEDVINAITADEMLGWMVEYREGAWCDDYFAAEKEARDFAEYLVGNGVDRVIISKLVGSGTDFGYEPVVTIKKGVAS